MTKVKTIPNQGTRKLTLPTGKVEFKNGEAEISSEDLTKLSKLSFGFKILSVDGSIVEAPQTEEDGKRGDKETEENVEMDMETLKAMRVKDLIEVADMCVANDKMSEGEMEDFKEMKKDEKIDYLFKVLNNVQ